MADRREAVRFLVDGGLSVHRACMLVQIHRSTFRYVAHPADDQALLTQLQELATSHPRYGYRRISALMAQHGAPVHLRSDNGPEFVALAVQTWLAQCGVHTL